MVMAVADERFNAASMSSYLDATGCPVDVACPPGAVLTVYNGDISQHFTVPSELVRITRGAIKYADHRAKFGQQTRFRFQLCNNYLHGRCPRLSECSYIHVTALPAPSEVHLNPYAPRRGAFALSPQDDPAVADSYETLPSGFVITVYPPNDAGVLEPQLIPSEMIIMTAGAVTARRWHQGVSVGNKPRHCAHFQFKRLCHLGSQCHFIHSKVPFL